MDLSPKQDHLRMNVALDRTIMLGVQIVLDHRSLSSICWRLWWAPQYSPCRPCPPWPRQAGTQGVRLVLYQFIADEGPNNEVLGDIHCNKVKLPKSWSLSTVQRVLTAKTARALLAHWTVEPRFILAGIK